MFELALTMKAMGKVCDHFGDQCCFVYHLIKINIIDPSIISYPKAVLMEFHHFNFSFVKSCIFTSSMIHWMRNALGYHIEFIFTKVFGSSWVQIIDIKVVESVFHGYTKQSSLATIAESTIPTSSTYLQAIIQGTDRLTNTFSTANQFLAHTIGAG
jgi:hypothetical protein